MTERAQQLALNLAAVRERVQRACDDAGRENDVTIVAVTKTYPVEDVRILYDLGVRAMGENKDQEAKVKAAACSDLGIEWHFIGQLQRNKARSVATYASVVETVDRPELATALGRANRRLEVLVQLSLDPPGTEHRGGVHPGDLPAVLDAIDVEASLVLRGVMGVAPLGSDPAAAFALLGQGRAEVLARHPEATWISAGMSHDLVQAVAAGATHVRIGTAILGERLIAR